MKRKIMAVLLSVVLLCGSAYLVNRCADLWAWARIRAAAEEVEEPAYTLVVNSEILQHDFNVRFDRFEYDRKTETFEGDGDGLAEIPLFTVLEALGAEITWVDENLIAIAYEKQDYLFQYAFGAMVTFDVYENKIAGYSEKQEVWKTWNLLLMNNGEPENYFRLENGECIVSLASLHRLALSMGFSWECDFGRGIVSFAG